MRGIAQLFDAIAASGPRRILVGVEILDDNRAANATDAAHLRKNRFGMHEVMEREAADNEVELAVAVYEIVGLADLEANVAEATLVDGALCDRDRRRGQVESDDFVAVWRQRHREVAGAGRDFQGAVIGPRIDGPDESSQSVGIGDYGRTGVGLRLARELFAHNCLMVVGFACRL